MVTKQCTKCKQSLPATKEFFKPDKRRKDGFGSWCRECNRKQSRKYYQNNLESERERCRKKSCRSRKDSKQRKIIYQRTSEWKQNNKEKVYINNTKRRHLKQNQLVDLTQDEKLQMELIYKRCRELGPSWQVDHIIPVSKSGLWHPDNLQIVTKKYNLQKHNKLDFRLPLPWEVI